LTDGRITLVATDHAPHLLSEKEGGALKAASGIPSLQYSLVAMLELARQGVCSVADVVRLMCRKPAERYGLSDRGVIEAGRRADLILVDPAGETAATPADIRSKCGWSPFEGVTFHSRVVGTWVNGKRVYEHA
jgi:dihydroorotase